MSGVKKSKNHIPIRIHSTSASDRKVVALDYVTPACRFTRSESEIVIGAEWDNSQQIIVVQKILYSVVKLMGAI